MKRVLLVDDEEPIISGLHLLIKRYFQDNYCVVGEASTGREAIEKAKELSPDIILIDVQMPGISGFDAIRTISQSGTPKAFILITAYERFEIAREALRLGVCDYILKPITKDRLEMALNSTSMYLERLRIIEERELKYIEREQRLIPLLKQSLFYTLKKGNASHQELRLLCSALTITHEYGCIVVAYFYPQQANSVPELYHHFAEYLQYKTEALTNDVEEDRYCTVLVPLRKNDTKELEEFTQVLQKEFSTELAIQEILLKYGSIEAVTDLQNSWNTAFATAHSGQAVQEEKRMLCWPIELDVSFLTEIERGQFGSAGRKLEEILSILKNTKEHSSEELFRTITMVGNMSIHIAKDIPLSDSDIRDLFNFTPLMQLWEKGLYDLYADGIRKHFFKISTIRAEHKHYSSTVSKALQYIENHFSEPILLEQVAEVIGVAPVTLSRLMTEDCGVGFARTLIDYRMKEAQELLRQGNMSIKEISVRCGYQDPNYFARLFKSITGMTPSEYSTSRKEEVHGT